MDVSVAGAVDLEAIEDAVDTASAAVAPVEEMESVNAPEPQELLEDRHALARTDIEDDIARFLAAGGAISYPSRPPMRCKPYTDEKNRRQFGRMWARGVDGEPNDPSHAGRREQGMRRSRIFGRDW